MAFGCQDVVREYYWHLVGRVQECCSTPCDTEDSSPRRTISTKMLIELRLKIADLVHEVRVLNIIVISQKRPSEAWRKYNFPHCSFSVSDRCVMVVAAFWSRRVYFVFGRNPYRPSTNPRIRSSGALRGSGSVKDSRASQSLQTLSRGQYHSSGTFLLSQIRPLWCHWVMGRSRRLCQGAGGRGGHP